jgi:hypothetical protein
MYHDEPNPGIRMREVGKLALGILLVVAAFVVGGIGLGGEKVALTLSVFLFVVGALLMIAGLLPLLPRLARDLPREPPRRRPVTIEGVLADLASLHESERRRVLRILAGQECPPREMFTSGPKRFGDRMQKAVDRVADAVRDSMLDWNPDAEDEPERPPPGSLPAVTPARLAEVMRPEVEAVLAEVARALNESAAPADLEARCEELHRLFGELLCVALERGEDLRVDAAVGARPVPGGPHGWAEGFRRIKAEEARQTESPGHG